MFAIGRGPSYVRFWPNPGFSFRVGWSKHWAHWCLACGHGLLKSNESRKAIRPATRRRVAKMTLEERRAWELRVSLPEIPEATE